MSEFTVLCFYFRSNEVFFVICYTKTIMRFTIFEFFWQGMPVFMSKYTHSLQEAIHFGMR